MTLNFRHFILFFVASFACLYLAFSATVNIPYTSHDSIRYFHKFYNRETEARVNPMYQYLYDEGRPLTAECEEFLYKKVQHLSDMSTLRLIAIGVMAGSCALLALLVEYAGIGRVPAFCLSCAIFTLPGIQEFIFVPYLSLSLALFFSLIAYLVTLNQLAFILRLILAFIILEAAFFAYPPVTLFFLVPTTFLIIFSQRPILKTLSTDVMFWAVPAMAYFLILKIFHYTQVKATGHEIAISTRHIWLNTLQFLPQIAPQVFNLWNVYYSKPLGILLMALVGGLIFIGLILNKISFKKLCALFVIFILLNIVAFVFEGFMPQQFIAAQAFLLILIYWLGTWICPKASFQRLWPIVILIFGLIFANIMVTSNVLNNYSELMFVRSRLAQFVNSQTKEIHFIGLKDGGRGYNGLPRIYDNINSITADYEIPDLVRASLRDLPDPYELHCNIVMTDYGQPFDISPNTVVVDMNDLVYISKK